MAIKKSKHSVIAGNISVDPEIMECRGVDTSAIAGFKMAMETGNEFAPVVLDKNTQLLVDGITRLEAFKRLYGPKAAIPVAYEDLPTTEARLMYSADKNAINGRRIGDWSLKKYACKLLALGVSHSAIELVLHVPHLTEDMIGGVQVITQNGTCELRPVKKGPNIVGPITEAEHRMHALHDRAGHTVVFANQLTRWITKGWVILDDRACEALIRLRDAITLHVPVPVPKVQRKSSKKASGGAKARSKAPAAAKPAAKVNAKTKAKAKPASAKPAVKAKAKAKAKPGSGAKSKAKTTP